MSGWEQNVACDTDQWPQHRTQDDTKPFSNGFASGNGSSAAVDGFDSANGNFNTVSGFDTEHEGYTSATGLGSGDDGAGFANSGGANTCRNCGQEGHFARECLEPRKPAGACFNCDEEGHTQAECTKPRKFKGECYLCGQSGHPAAECPDRTIVCKQCLEEGHEALVCTNPKKLDYANVPDKTEVEAWDMLSNASNERDITDFKEAVLILSKANVELTYVDLENEFRKRGFSVYLIAMEKDHGDTWTNVNLQGEVGKKFAIGYYLSPNAQRPNLASKWPTSAAENIARLQDAGVPVNRGVSKCNNCGELGHISKRCTQDKSPFEQPTVTCALCGEQGHRVRDCTQKRPQSKPKGCRICEGEDHLAKDCPNREKRTCRNCGSEDHMARECPNREKRTCRNCGSEDHIARDCDQPRNPDSMKCHNCEQTGHMSRDCPAPKDWSKHKCSNCGEMGHGPRRCKQPLKDVEGNGFEIKADKTGGVNDVEVGGWNDGNTITASTNNDWENHDNNEFGGGDATSATHAW